MFLCGLIKIELNQSAKEYFQRKDMKAHSNIVNHFPASSGNFSTHFPSLSKRCKTCSHHQNRWSTCRKRHQGEPTQLKYDRESFSDSALKVCVIGCTILSFSLTQDVGFLPTQWSNLNYNGPDKHQPWPSVTWSKSVLPKVPSANSPT